MLYLLTISLGIFFVSYLPVLPNGQVCLAITVALSAGLWIIRRCRHIATVPYSQSIIACVLCFAWGVCWAVMLGHQTLSQQLPDSLDKQEFTVTGSVVGLVDEQKHRMRFELAVESIERVGVDHSDSDSADLPLRRLLLSWYSRSSEQDQSEPLQIRSGDHWQLAVRLRRPRGMLNQGGFDYQAWLVERGYSATGYIVPSDLNQRLDIESHWLRCRLIGIISRLREEIRDAIQASQLTDLGKAVISALTIGDKKGLTVWWDDLMRLGIVHLLVISGLHIGLVASLGFYAGALLSRVILVFFSLLPINLQHAGLVRWLSPCLGFLLALGYSFLAGFSLPTQRALIAVAVVMLAKLVYRQVRVGVALVWALVFIAASQPLAVLGAGFWLSFLAVAILLIWFSPWISTGSTRRRLLGSQLALGIGLAAPGLLFIGKVSWLGAMVNLIAVPWISMVTVPLCLMAGLVYFMFPQLAEQLWLLASWSIEGLWYLLDLLPDKLGLIHLSVPVTPIFLGGVIMAALGVLMPRGVPGRWLCFLPVLVAMLAPGHQPPLRLSVLDVGQGLAVVLESPNKLLVYDSGPAYSEQFNAGTGIVAPFLRRRGKSSIDKLLISHEDADHVGGFYGLIDAVETKEAMLAPGFFRDYYRAQVNSAIKVEQCVKPRHWSWLYFNPKNRRYESIYFDVLLPDSESPLKEIPSGNNYSCVLLIRWRDQSILLTGDIERAAEKKLLNRYKLAPVTVMVAPHHGSKTSSSWQFVTQLKPLHSVFSAGFRHQYGHPHPQVVQRYKDLGSTLWNTADQGGITFIWNHNAEIETVTARATPPLYWWR